ncbi:MAG: hypothetical protein IJV46_08990 [Acidaminococcaceae bacterium]|nr:hypothetical protein [Acidaminococcaceae bacterium]
MKGSALLISLMFFFMTGFAHADIWFKEELTRPTGTNWGFPGYRVEYTVSNPEIAEVIRGRDGQYRVHLLKPGDVIVAATFFRSGAKLAPEYYLFHVTGNPVDETAVDDKAFAREVIRLTNKHRAEAGLKPLYLAKDLCDLAMIRAEEASCFYSHNRPNGQPFNTVFKEGSYEYVGENIQGGASSPQKVVEQWMKSPSHRKNILSDAYDELGVGYIYVPESKYRHYWVQLFRR